MPPLLSQEEVVTSTKLVMQGLDALRVEHHQIMTSLLVSMKTIQTEKASTAMVEEKMAMLQKATETIELALGEAQVTATV